jgi:hypothetical protein
MVETNVITLALNNGFQAEDTGGNCNALVRHFNGFDVVITSMCGVTIPESVTEGIEVGVYGMEDGAGWEHPAMFYEARGSLLDFFKGNERKRTQAVEKLREVYQKLQDEIENPIPDDGAVDEKGTQIYMSDGQWLDVFMEAVKELLEHEARP